MEKSDREMDNALATEQEPGKKSHMAFEILLLMSAAVVVGALAVGMFIMVLP